MNNQATMYINLADILFRAVKKLEFGNVLELDKEAIFNLRDRILKIFYKNFELKEYSGELVVSDRNTGEVVRDKYYNTLSLNQVLNRIAKKIHPMMGLEKEMQNLASEQDFTRYMKKTGIPKNSQLRSKLYKEWIHVHKDEQVKQASEYWF